MANWLIRRVRDIVPGGRGEGDRYPKERRVCILSFLIRTGFMLAPALTVWQFVPLAAVFRAMLTYLAAVMGAFVYADLGPEEWLRRLLLGYSYNPNVFPLGTLEAFCGSIDKSTQTAWQQLKMTPLRPWDGTPGSGRFGDE